MKKIFIALLALIIIGGAGAAYFISQNLDSFIAKTIEEEGTASLGSKVTVASVVTDLVNGKASISGLNVANPAGFTNDYAIELNSFSAEVDYATQTIKKITINKPIINAELKGDKSNFEVLLDNMPESDESEESEASQSDQVITIKRLILSKATVNLLAKDYAPAAKYGLSNDLDLDRSFEMKDFALNNISGTADQISEEISEKLMDHVSGEVKRFVTAELKAQATAKLKEKATEKLEEVLGDKLGDKLKGLNLKF